MANLISILTKYNNKIKTFPLHSHSALQSSESACDNLLVEKNQVWSHNAYLPRH